MKNIPFSFISYYLLAQPPWADVAEKICVLLCSRSGGGSNLLYFKSDNAFVNTVFFSTRPARVWLK